MARSAALVQLSRATHTTGLALILILLFAAPHSTGAQKIVKLPRIVSFFTLPPEAPLQRPLHCFTDQGVKHGATLAPVYLGRHPPLTISRASGEDAP